MAKGLKGRKNKKKAAGKQSYPSIEDY